MEARTREAGLGWRAVGVPTAISEASDSSSPTTVLVSVGPALRGELDLPQRAADRPAIPLLAKDEYEE